MAKKEMTVKEMASLGGIARAEMVKAGLLPVTGAAVPKPTVCPRCGVEQPSARQAWVHCRVPKGKKATKMAAKKAGKKARKKVG
ncbi:MAG: hypothetical protein M3N41_10215 [Acidobacteriota bacterium]|nr:hypothetical protein [Acidobacteriota bacterium]